MPVAPERIQFTISLERDFHALIKREADKEDYSISKKIERMLKAEWDNNHFPKRRK